MSATRYRIQPKGTVWCIDRFDRDTATWVRLPREFDADSAELAGRAVDAMVAMDLLSRERVT